jgi:hypothetical protein
MTERHRDRLVPIWSRQSADYGSLINTASLPQHQHAMGTSPSTAPKIERNWLRSVVCDRSAEVRYDLAGGSAAARWVSEILVGGGRT